MEPTCSRYLEIAPNSPQNDQAELLRKLQLSDPALHAMMIGNRHYFSNVPPVFTVNELPYFDDIQMIYKVRAHGYKAPRPSENTTFYFAFSELTIDPSDIRLHDKIKILKGFPHPNNFRLYVIHSGTNKGQRRTVATQFPENGTILESLPTLTAGGNRIQQKPPTNETRKELLARLLPAALAQCNLPPKQISTPNVDPTLRITKIQLNQLTQANANFSCFDAFLIEDSLHVCRKTGQDNFRCIDFYDQDCKKFFRVTIFHQQLKYFGQLARFHKYTISRVLLNPKVNPLFSLSGSCHLRATPMSTFAQLINEAPMEESKYWSLLPISPHAVRDFKDTNILINFVGHVSSKLNASLPTRPNKVFLYHRPSQQSLEIVICDLRFIDFYQSISLNDVVFAKNLRLASYRGNIYANQNDYTSFYKVPNTAQHHFNC